MAKPQQTASELGRTLAGQWSKTEKRAAMSRSIMEANQRTKAINKAFKQQQFMKYLNTEAWPSGRRHLPTKQTYGQLYREFESHRFRQGPLA